MVSSDNSCIRLKNKEVKWYSISIRINTNIGNFYEQVQDVVAAVILKHFYIHFFVNMKRTDLQFEITMTIISSDYMDEISP